VSNEPTVNVMKKPESKRHGFLVDLLIRLVKQKPLGTFGLIVILMLLLTGIFASVIAPFKMNEIHLLDMLRPPGPVYVLGTDQLGRDIFSNLIYGARVSVIIGLSASALQTIFSTALGSISAMSGGKFDLFFQRFVDGWISIPTFLILLTLVTITGRGMIQIIVIIGIPSSIGTSRVIRSAVIGLKENVYIEAARAIGSPDWKTFFRHILPNIMPIVIILFSMQVGAAILIESSLSFLGFGVPPGVPSWGSMLSQEGRQYMELVPAMALWPGAALSITVYGINMFGDALRDLLDPRLKGGRIGRYSGVKKKKTP
jgi:peptide/nickel transport system permease protein